MNTIKSATRSISDFLDERIRPLFNKHNKDNIIIDGASLITRLEEYAANGYLKASTLFCIFDINNLFTMLPQEEAIKILGKFLRHFVGEKLKDIPATTIEKLAAIEEKMLLSSITNSINKLLVVLWVHHLH